MCNQYLDIQLMFSFTFSQHEVLCSISWQLTLHQVNVASISPVANNPCQVKWRNNIFLNCLQYLSGLLHFLFLLPRLLIQCLNPLVILAIGIHLGHFLISWINNSKETQTTSVIKSNRKTSFYTSHDHGGWLCHSQMC